MKGLSETAWLAIGRLGGDALAFGLFILVAREFGPAGTGAYVFTFAIATLFYEVVSLGIEEYGVREYARRAPAARSKLIGELLGAQLALGSAFALAVLIAGTMAERIDLPLLAFMLAYQLAFAVSRTLFIPAFVGGKVVLQVLAETSTRAAVLATAALIIARASDEPSLSASLLGLPVFGGALALAALACARRFAGTFRIEPSLGALRTAVRSLWPFAAANVVSGLYTRTAILVLFVAAGSIEAGLFAGAYKFAELGWALLILVPWAGYPALARLARVQGAAFRRLAGSVLGMTLLAGGLLAWGTYFFVPPLIGALLGAEFEAGTSIVRILAGFVALVAVNEYLERIVLVADLQVARLKILAAQAALHLVLTLALVPALGMYGAAIALIASQAIAVPMLLGAARRLLPLGDALRPLAIYALALAGAMLGAALLPWGSSTFWLACTASVAAFILIAHSGGLLQLARASGRIRVGEAWGR